MRKYLGVIGDPIHHSLSPFMHNAALKKQQLEYIYLPLKVAHQDLADAVKGLKGLQFAGVNVTIPYKVAIVPYLDQISKEAQLIGAVNTIHLQDGKLIGYNTDGIGFLRSLKDEGGVNPEGLSVLLFGAGGAARAVAIQLGLAGAKEIVICNRTLSKGECLAKECEEKIKNTVYRAIDFELLKLETEMDRTDIIINATPIGMVSVSEKELPLKKEWFKPTHLVADLVYHPLETPLLKFAHQAGAKTLSGVGMLVYQGAEAYKIWTGVEPQIEVMREAVLQRLREEE
ncbi:MAG: shikimate dehydrogenase [Halanaerobiales bacterium]|nr:shikimate dehydrogenase [Halanaerobiales bacterium]